MQAINYSYATNSTLAPLGDSDIARLCPAAYAEAPRDDVSSRYGFVSTRELIQALREHNFVPTQVNSYHRRNEEDRNFTKHLIRFRPAGDDLKAVTVGDVVPQLILVNSHDRSSQFSLIGGLWRLVCANGLMVSDGAKVEPMVVRHTTSAVSGLIAAADELVKRQKFVFEYLRAMRKLDLSEKGALEFAALALALRPERAGKIDPAQLLKVNRKEDEGLSLWKVFNRTQENLMRGGQTGITANNRTIVTRGVTGVNGDMHINAGLWRLAVETIAKAQASSAATVRKAAPKKAKATKPTLEASKAPTAAASPPAGPLDALVAAVTGA